MAACRDCGSPMRFVLILSTGRRMPVDPNPDPGGNVAAARDAAGAWVGRVMRKGEEPPEGWDHYMPHKATCAVIQQNRPRSQRPKAPPPPTLFDGP